MAWAMAGWSLSAARRFEHVVQESIAAARVDPAQRSGLAAEHEKRSWPRLRRHACADGGELVLHPIGHAAGLCFEADARTQRPNRFRDVGQSAVDVRKHGDAGGFELALQVGLSRVHDNEVGLEREEPFDVRVEQRAETRQLFDLPRIPIVAADADDPVAGADRKQHLRCCRHERYDAVGNRLARAEHRHTGEQRRQRYARLNSSHKNTGPPMTAVTMPTGSSTGASTVRATRSQPMRNAAPNSADAGSTSR